MYIKRPNVQDHRKIKDHQDSVIMINDLLKEPFYELRETSIDEIQKIEEELRKSWEY